MEIRPFTMLLPKRYLAAVFLTFIAGSGSAEVIDKIATPSQLWTNALQWGLAFGVVAFLVAPRRLPVLLLVAVAVRLALPPVIELEFIPEAVQHYGPDYPIRANIAAWLVPLGAAAGAAFKVVWRRSKQRDA